MTKIGRMLFEDGMKEGRSEERKKTAERLLEKGIDMDVIMDATDLTEAGDQRDRRKHTVIQIIRNP